jgi:hypothetical protein
VVEQQEHQQPLVRRLARLELLRLRAGDADRLGLLLTDAGLLALEWR